ncbi:MAG: hypothetical protein LC790_04290 [Actinobacteria bacterium]|nr:hypothetical protein [Actinomycetota bacterium]MCA1698151.1 hypothetical protein [Actinomycetota bacterium]
MVAGVMAFLLLVPALSIVDYLSGLLGSGAMNASCGVFAAVLVSGALIVVARASEPNAAALQQLVLCALAVAAAGLLAGKVEGSAREPFSARFWLCSS